ncbi:MAG: anti-sigma factor [Puniceicoccaceae bacterium]
MNDETQQRLEAWFDGELSPQEHAEVENLIDRDDAARAYVDQLARSRELLHGAHVSKVDGDAAWESVRERLEQADRQRSARILTFPQLVAAAAAVMLVGMGVWFPLRKMGQVDEAYALESTVEMVETELEGATPIVYIDEPSGWTVVWVVEAETVEGAG